MTNFETTLVSDAPKATFHKCAERFATNGNSKGKVYEISGWWAAEFDAHGNPKFLDTFIKSAPTKMKSIDRIKWTWKTEDTGRKNIDLVRQAIPAAKLIHISADGTIDKVYDI